MKTTQTNKRRCAKYGTAHPVHNGTPVLSHDEALEMLLELAEDNALLDSMSSQTRSYSPSEALHVLEFMTADVRAFTWFLDEAHSIDLICSYETEDVGEPHISTEHEALAALHWLADEIAKEEHP